ncbi:glycosyltransferase [Rhodococcus sp. P1Y]|uniref:glycosyltransferase n=1 Tax=Rhodococcus sp. P1Y TaxID=1302308 RepID=UPI00129391FC|nr:glycosyltransferase [Rhodococcus sp. P1Y]
MVPKKLKVLHVSEAFGGGVRSAIIHYITGTDQYEHSLFARVRVGHETLDVPEGVEVHQVDSGLKAFFLEARRVVREGDYDIVHLHSSYAGALRAILPRGTRIVYSPHCYVMEAGHGAVKNGVYFTVEKVLAQRRQMLVAVSPHEEQIGHGLRDDMPSAVVENIVMPAKVRVGSSNSDSNAHRADDKPVISMIGRIMAQKDPEFFAHVCSELGTSRYRYRWIGEGDADSRALLERAGVEITGWIPPNRVRELLRSSDLYLHTAAWEGGPLATLEAADVGCPVLARSIPSMESLGYALAGTQPHDAAQAVDQFFADPEYRESVRLATKAIAQAGTLDRMSRNLVDAYDEAMRVL